MRFILSSNIHFFPFLLFLFYLQITLAGDSSSVYPLCPVTKLGFILYTSSESYPGLFIASLSTLIAGSLLGCI